MPERPKNFVDVEDNDEACVGDTHATVDTFECPPDGMLVTKNVVAKCVSFSITNPTWLSTLSSEMEVEHASMNGCETGPPTKTIGGGCRAKPGSGCEPKRGNGATGCTCHGKKPSTK